MHPALKMRFNDYKRHFVLIKLYRGAPKHRSDLLGAKKFSDFPDFASSTDIMSCTARTDWLVVAGLIFCSTEHRWQFISVVWNDYRMHPALKIQFIDYKHHFVLITLYKTIPKHRSDLLRGGGFKYNLADFCLLYRYTVSLDPTYSVPVEKVKI